MARKKNDEVKTNDKEPVKAPNKPKEERFRYYEELTPDEQQIILYYEEKLANITNSDIEVTEKHVKKKYGGHTVPPFVLMSMKIVVEHS